MKRKPFLALGESLVACMDGSYFQIVGAKRACRTFLSEFAFEAQSPLEPHWPVPHGGERAGQRRRGKIGEGVL
ncbi:conserved hypothetical protein [Coccidioides posadasii str. Silveira]|uniref:Uncharacterized protein n=1 Tax=Coccidioides posadasii (strain RMSCC 757 / Silveira) TaxID=443226 RepID=E9DC71_COCPS|nr:conserved hypothetical protein [Coccidioides posadasii str. Silveira]